MYQSLQGNYGLGAAIAYFTSHKIPVCLPLNDTQKYDLVVDMDGELKRVSVKTGKYQAPSGAYAIQLKNSGGTSKGSKIRNFENTTCDLLFFLCGDESMYLIPAADVNCVSSITLGSKYQKYKVEKMPFEDFQT